MMHTHLLSPIKFSRDMKSSPRYSALAGAVEFPLLALLEKMRNIDRAAPELDKSKEKWNEKFRNIPYDLVLGYIPLGDKTFPPNMMIDLISFNLKTFRFTSSAIPLFSLDRAQAVKRQIAFARKITTILSLRSSSWGTSSRLATAIRQIMNLIRLNAVPNPVPSMDMDVDLF